MGVWRNRGMRGGLMGIRHLLRSLLMSTNYTSSCMHIMITYFYTMLNIILSSNST